MRNKSFGILGALLAIASSNAYSFDLSIALKAGTEVFSQLSDKVSNKIANGNGVNIEDEYNTYLSKLDGYDPAFKEKMKAQLDAGWEAQENVYLSKNASLNASEDTPFLDLKKVGGAAVSGLADSYVGGMGGAATLGTSGGLGDLIGYSAINGVGDALSGREQSNTAMKYSFNGSSYGIGQANAMNYATRNAVSDVTGKASTGVANKLFASFGNSKTEFVLNKYSDPSMFFGKKVGEFTGKDLYAMNGFYGFKRVVNQENIQVYQFIHNHSTLKQVIYGTDPKTKELLSAIKELKGVEPLKFPEVVDAVAKAKNEKPMFANTADQVRAIWSDGTFVAADLTKVLTGWSKSAIGLYNTGIKQAAN